MHIFLVNDDGIMAVGIQALMHAAVERGHRVSMCAPSAQQSAASHRITLHEPVFVSPFETKYAPEQVTAYAIAGTPADCVRVGLRAYVKDPVDVLISGINNGYNAGMDVHYSGTVGAAMEGAMQGIHAIASSIGWNASQATLDAFAKQVIIYAETYAKTTPISPSVLNINAPKEIDSENKKTVYAPLDSSVFHDTYERRVSPHSGDYFWMTNDGRTNAPQENSDRDWLAKGHVTCTIIGNPVCHEQSAFDDLGLV